MAKHRCPVCEEPVKRGSIRREGWALNVPAERLRWTHLDGKPLCPEMTDEGQLAPALPEQV